MHRRDDLSTSARRHLPASSAAREPSTGGIQQQRPGQGDGGEARGYGTVWSQLSGQKLPLPAKHLATKNVCNSLVRCEFVCKVARMDERAAAPRSVSWPVRISNDDRAPTDSRSATRRCKELRCCDDIGFDVVISVLCVPLYMCGRHADDQPPTLQDLHPKSAAASRWRAPPNFSAFRGGRFTTASVMAGCRPFRTLGGSQRVLLASVGQEICLDGSNREAETAMASVRRVARSAMVAAALLSIAIPSFAERPGPAKHGPGRPPYGRDPVDRRDCPGDKSTVEGLGLALRRGGQTSPQEWCGPAGQRAGQLGRHRERRECRCPARVMFRSDPPWR